MKRKKDDPEDRTHGVGPGRGIHSRLYPFIPAFNPGLGRYERNFSQRAEPLVGSASRLRFVTDRIFSLDSDWSYEAGFSSCHHMVLEIQILDAERLKELMHACAV